MINPQFISVPEMIAINAKNRPNTIAFQTSSQQVTWREFDLMVNASANALIGEGLERGKAVAMLLNSSLWSWTHLFGVMRAGGVVAPLNTMLSAAVCARMLADSGATHFIASSVDSALAADTLKQLVASQAPPLLLTQSGSPTGSMNLSALVQQSASTPPDVVLTEQDDANIIYSSGTTGLPKGIVHTHGARATFALLCAVGFRCSATTRSLLTIAPHSNASFAVVLSSAAVGGTIYVSEGFKAERYLDEVRDFRPTFAFMVPTMAQQLVDHPRASQTDWNCFEFIVTGGAPMAAELKRRVREMTGDRLGELWGLTEVAGTIIQPHEMEFHPESVGRAAPQTEVRVIDHEGREVASGVIGELVVRSGYMMRGYHRRPDETRELLWQAPGGGQFLRTGDLAVMDDDGWIAIKGRKKDMLISGGQNIYPIDIESVVITHEAIQDCTVVGVPHEKWGETPVAFVIAKPGVDVDEGALMAWVNENVGRHQRLHDIVVVAEFPRNTLGKVMKRQLVEAYGSDRTSAIA